MYVCFYCFPFLHESQYWCVVATHILNTFFSGIDVKIHIHLLETNDGHPEYYESGWIIVEVRVWGGNSFQAGFPTYRWESHKAASIMGGTPFTASSPSPPIQRSKIIFNIPLRLDRERHWYFFAKHSNSSVLAKMDSQTFYCPVSE